MTQIESTARGKRRPTRLLKQVTVACLSVAATTAFGLTAPAASHTPVTTEGLAAMPACMTAHQAWVWEKAVLSVPAVVLVPPHICP
jgi:hypothetical protein